MKKIYWRPQGVPVFAFVLVALFSMSGLAAVEYFKTEERAPYYKEKLEASQLTLKAMDVIRNEWHQRGHRINQEIDPMRSGLVGALATPVTSDPGDLEAKQTTINPNFGGVIVDLLKQAGVRKGDTIAVHFSGSFPVLNMAVLAALKTLELKATIISTGSASQWGANDPRFLWIDMESVLNNKGLTPYRSSAASLGGRNDRGREMTEKGRQYIIEAIKRNNIQLITARSLRENIDERLNIYFRTGRPKVYINVGGGLVSVGIRPFKIFLTPGLLPSELPGDTTTDSVIRRFLDSGISVIHLGNIKQLATMYGLPVTPTSIPRIGEGRLYYRIGYNRWLAGVILLGTLFGLYVFARSDWGFRLLQFSAKKEEVGPPEPMV
jgi:poly-gamma-glutamate system protein